MAMAAKTKRRMSTSERTRSGGSPRTLREVAVRARGSAGATRVLRTIDRARRFSLDSRNAYFHARSLTPTPDAERPAEHVGSAGLSRNDAPQYARTASATPAGDAGIERAPCETAATPGPATPGFDVDCATIGASPSWAIAIDGPPAP